MQLFVSVDEPGLLVGIVVYSDRDAYDRDQARVESDPEMQAMLARFAECVGAPVEVRKLHPLAL